MTELLANKRAGGRRRRLRLVAWSAVIVLLSSTLFFNLDRSRVSRLASHLAGSLLNHPYFSVQEIKVTGGKWVGGSEVIAMTGLRDGMNIWKVDPKSIEAKVAKHPWVKRVLVEREFPQRVVIEIEEWVARGIVVLGRLYYVDGEGIVFKEVAEGEELNFPLVTGLQWGDIVSHSRSAREKIAEALRLGQLIEQDDPFLSEIHFHPYGGVVIYPIFYPMALHMGWGDWPDKVRQLKRVLAEWRGKEDRIAALDLRYRDQVVARIRKEVGAF